MLAGAGSVQDATAVGETRTLSFHHTHSREDLTVTFKRSGRYDEAALKQLNHFLRDWRTQDSTTMDRRLFDILWEVYRDVDGKQPINVISSYRSPATNAMLRRRSSGVARHSQHMLGHAMDFYIPGVALEKIRFAGLRLQRGGVGFYPTSGSPFVHLDTGSIRHWPRMTPDQLARVFPDGRTVHVPTNGQPLRGYQLALADIQNRGNGDSAAANGKPGFFASLFSRTPQADDEDEATAVVAPAAPSKSAAEPAAVASADPVPMPRAKPAAAARIQVASADASPVAASAAPLPVARQPQTPADIINARGFWDDIPAPRQATPAQVAALKARQAVGGEPQTTASVAVMQAMAYAPPLPAERPHLVTASAPMPRLVRPASPARDPMAVDPTMSVANKGQAGRIVTANRLSAKNIAHDIWTRAMILAPSAHTAMLATSFGDQDLTVMKSLFVKPRVAVAMTFSDDPHLGMTCETFSGAAIAALPTRTFAIRTASLR